MDPNTGRIYSLEPDAPVPDCDVPLNRREARHLSRLSAPDRIEWARRRSESADDRATRKRLRKLQRAARRAQR